jgi:RND family efflux transporter MFP subunit
MNDQPEVMERVAAPARRTRWVLRILVGLVLLASGAAGGILWAGRHGTPPREPRAGSGSPAAPTSTGGSNEEPVEILLTPASVRRAGIKTARVSAATITSTVTVPATVTSNAYRDTKVNALVGGIVRDVRPELGAAVMRGATLAVVFSVELAGAQMKYLSTSAMLEADHQKLERTTRLVEIGAASRQELEETRAVHAGHETEVAAARQRLLLLGLSGEQVLQLRDASQVVSEVLVRAPGNGVVIGRTVNAGQVVTAGQELFTVTDLGTVWVIGDLYEKDFAAVRVDAPATVIVTTSPARPVRGRVAYVDPRVDPTTRTAKVRVEVPNPEGRLRLGMYVNITLELPGGGQATLVPRSAVQSIGERSVVYIAANGEEGRFTERTVKLGRAVAESVEVVEGVKPGDRVVTEGSFLLRAEAARMRTGA